ncbi:MAG: lamin tail domain-containing protein [Bacteroidia bacterium]|nr:lamin tail domain-containing protein [Bacteroidia bacterium]MDW8158964.1 lamin tail domain-containing protein [Bacteroidia bacterium]
MKKLFIILVIVTSFCVSLRAQDCSEPFISEYVEGSGNNKALELYNPTNRPFSLRGYKLLRFSNGSQTPTEQIILNNVTIPPYGTFVIVNGQKESQQNSPACDPNLQALADMLDGTYPAVCYFNGDDAIALVKSNSSDLSEIEEFVDIFGKIGQRPQTAWTNVFPYDGSVKGKWITANLTLIRKPSIKKGVKENPEYFDALSQWDTLPINTWTELRKHNCECNPASRGKDFYSKNTFYVKLYPNTLNASMAILNIQTEIPFDKVEVLDSNGKLVLHQKWSSPLIETKLSMQGLPAGIYFVRVHSLQHHITTSKLIINN